MQIYQKHRIYCIFLLFLWSCGSQSQKGNDQVFRLNMDNDLSSLDPAFAKDQFNMWAVHQVYNTLVEFDGALNVKPSLAAHWEIEDSGRCYRFFLRKDVYFHSDPCFSTPENTRQLKAADVVYSLQRLLDGTLASPGAWILNDKLDLAKLSEKVQAINDSVLEIRLLRPFPPFLGMLAMQYCSVVPHEAVKFYGTSFRAHPVGTGPFKIKLWKEGVKLVLERNANYFEKDSAGNSLPYLDGVEISFVENKQSSFMEFNTGRLDFFNGLESTLQDELLTPQGTLRPDYAAKFRLQTGPYLNTEYLGMMVEEGSDMLKGSPFALKAFRQALNMAIDKQKLVAYLRRNLGDPANGGMIPAGLPGHVDLPQYGFNPEKARELVKSTGLPLPVKISIYTSPNYLDLTLFIQEELRKINVDCTIEVNQSAAQRQQMAQARLQFFRASWIADYPDAENYLALFYSPFFTPNGPNYTRFKSAAFDKAYEQMLLETDVEKRVQAYSHMDALVMEEAPVIPLFYDRTFRLVQPWVSGLENNPLNMLELRKVRKIQ